MKPAVRVPLFGQLIGTGSKRYAFFCVVFGLLVASSTLPTRAGLAVSAIATLAAGAWCLTNFASCGEAHCIVTGSGWTLLGIFELAEVAAGRSLLGGAEQLAFLAVLAAGALFEGCWRFRYHTNAVGGARSRI